MPPWSRLGVLALAAAALLGGKTQGDSALRIVSPADGSTVAVCGVEVAVKLRGRADPGTLEAELNGQPIALEAADEKGRKRFGATLGADSPLASQNTLVVSAGDRREPGTTHTQSVQFTYAPPEPRARRITSAADLVTGPLAQGRLGDWLLENCEARFVIQDAAKRDLHSVGQYGGNVIDAEIVGRPGRDEFFEIQPALNVETVINAQSVEIVNDGANGAPAVVRTCGPDDLIDYINPSSVAEDLGFELPASANDTDLNIDGCTEYRLGAGRRYLELETFVMNHDPTVQGLFVGDYVNGMGQLEQWTPPTAGVGEIFVTVPSASAQSYFGLRSSTGVDYAAVPVEIPGSPFPTSSFTTSGVSFVAQSHSIITILLVQTPVFFVPGAVGGEPGVNSFLRYFSVGEGSPSNATDLMNEVFEVPVGRLRGCVTVGGEPEPAARVAVGPAATDAIASLSTLFVADEAGCFEGTLEPGSYSAAASQEGTPYEGGGATPALRDVTIVEGETTLVDFALPASGRVEVKVRDERGKRVPARVSVVGFDQSPEPRIFTTGLELVTTGLFRDVTKDPLPFGLAWIEYTDADGRAAFDLDPGSYWVFVSRGTEYSAFEAPLTVAAGSTTRVDARVARVLDTPGFISSDYHVHMLNSPDSRVGLEDRARSFAGEGRDNIIATDHDAHTDLLPTIADLGLEKFVHATVGEEITSFDYGHWNGYPQAVDPTRPSGGSTDWAGAAPPGEDFPSSGNFTLTPGEIASAAEDSPANAGLATVVHVNHIGSHFGPLKIDTSLPGGPASLLSDAEKERLRFCSQAIAGSCAARGELFHHFAALELWNGSSSGAQSAFLDERIGIWMNHLNHGLLTTAIADTDTHSFTDLEQAGAATWTSSSTDEPRRIRDREIGEAVRAGRAVGGQGLYVQARLLATDGSGAVADFELGGSTLACGGQRRGGSRDLRAGAALGRVRHHRDLSQRDHLRGGDERRRAGGLLGHPDADAPGRSDERRERVRGHGAHRLPEDRRRGASRERAQRALLGSRGGLLVRGRGEGDAGGLGADVPGLPAQPADLGKHEPRGSARREPGRGRRPRARLHERALRRRGRGWLRGSRGPDAARLLSLRAGLRSVAGWLAAASLAAASGAPARAAGLLDAVERAPASVVGRVHAPARVDLHGRAAELRVERALRGAHAPGARLRIAWEELSRDAGGRFRDGERILVALEPLPDLSLWRQRFPDGRALAVAERGGAFLRDPDAASVDLLAAWLALAPEERGEAAGARALAALAVGAEPGLAEGALARLASQGGWDAEGSPAVELLLGALADAGRPPALRRGILTLAGTRRIRALRPGVARLAGEPGPLRADALDALARLDAGLPAAQLRELLASADPALRTVAVRHAGAALGVAELAELARTDPDATVRAAVVGALAARGGAEALEGASAGLFDADPGVRNEAILALAARGAEGVPLCQRLASERRAPEAGAPVAVLALAGPAGRDALAELALHHPDPKVRDLARLALGRPLPEH